MTTRNLPGTDAARHGAGETFKRQLHLHHTAEDAVVWPALRQRAGLLGLGA